jgi:hypothetical protein
MSGDGWHRVEPVDVPDDGRVRSVVVGGRTVALARCGARLGALDNRCPHQLTGLYDAKLDHAPVIAISGQVPSKVLGRGATSALRHIAEGLAVEGLIGGATVGLLASPRGRRPHPKCIAQFCNRMERPPAGVRA